MRPVSAWAHMMSSHVGIATRTGSDAYGKPTYGTAVTYQAHISRKRRIVRTAAGQEVVSEQSVVLNTNVDVPLTAQVTLSTGDVGSTESWAINPYIVSVLRAFDESGPHHTTLYL